MRGWLASVLGGFIDVLIALTGLLILGLLILGPLMLTEGVRDEVDPLTLPGWVVVLWWALLVLMARRIFYSLTRKRP